jgi:hypothetical protein
MSKKSRDKIWPLSVELARRNIELFYIKIVVAIIIISSIIILLMCLMEFLFIIIIIIIVNLNIK